jgi:malate dehydrogenase (oxaloacetate-decarboxylating)(NADP+)
MVKKMARDPLIFAMANPIPEIMPEDALAVRPDAIIGTGRSDYPTRSTTSCAFRSSSGARLDCGATTINEE